MNVFVVVTTSCLFYEYWYTFMSVLESQFVFFFFFVLQLFQCFVLPQSFLFLFFIFWPYDNCSSFCFLYIFLSCNNCFSVFLPIFFFFHLQLFLFFFFFCLVIIVGVFFFSSQLFQCFFLFSLLIFGFYSHLFKNCSCPWRQHWLQMNPK